MKTLVTLVPLTLMCFLHHSSGAPYAASMMSQEGCCKNVTQLQIPKGRVKYVVKTPSDCPSEAIVVTSVCDKKFCIDATWTWAKDLLTEFENSIAQNKSASAPFNVVPASKCAEPKKQRKQ